MKNIILDTNAFIYLTNYERRIANTICLEKKSITDEKMHEYCLGANHLFITGQSLYELFWQSLENTGGIDEFAMLYDAIAKYRRIYKVKFSVLNDINCMFDLKLFAEQFRSGEVDIQYFVEQKREYEVDRLRNIIKVLYTSALGIVLDVYNADITPDFLAVIDESIEMALQNVSKIYYQSPGNKNEDYDKAIEQILESVWKACVDLIGETGSEYGITIPKVRSGEGGSLYMHKLFCKLRKNRPTIFREYDDYLEEICNGLKGKGKHEEELKYLKWICKRSIYNGTKVKKNDGIDFSIITCVAKDNILNETNHEIDLNRTYLLTFDKNLYTFSKESNVLYNQEIYEELVN